MGKKNGAEQGLKNQQKMITESLERKKMTKRKSNLKSIKSQNVNSYYGKNGKVITINFIIITVITEIIVKKQTLIQSKSAYPTILNVKRPNIYTHIN